MRESKFLQTKNLDNNIQFLQKLDQILMAFGINWTSQCSGEICLMRHMPLYSMIAACLVIYLTPHEIPPANDLQARFWVQYYNPDGDENEFIGVASAFQGIV